MVGNFFSELLRVFSFFHDPHVIILILLIDVGFRKVTHCFEELSNLFVILENLPVLYVVQDGWSVPYLYMVF